VPTREDEIIVPATETPTETPTQEIPVETPTETATETALAPEVQGTIYPTRTPAVCGQPAGWTEYVVQGTETLYTVAEATGATVSLLRDVNCLQNVSRIQAGDHLFVPNAAILPVVTSTPVIPAPEITLTPEGCSTGLITAPAPMEHFTGVMTIYGTANGDNFGRYQLDIRPDAETDFDFYSDSFDPVTDGVLGLLNSDLYEDGLHWLRLTVISADSAVIDTCTVPVIFE
jgi:LysM repeat protein